MAKQRHHPPPVAGPLIQKSRPVKDGKSKNFYLNLDKKQPRGSLVRRRAVPTELPTPSGQAQTILIDLALVTATNRLAKHQGLTLRQQIRVWRPFS